MFIYLNKCQFIKNDYNWKKQCSIELKNIGYNFFILNTLWFNLKYMYLIIGIFLDIIVKCYIKCKVV